MRRDKQRVNAGIVLYNPDIIRLKANIDSIYKQVERVIVVDNDSHNILEVEQLLMNYSNILLIRNSYNCGIATALNQIFKESMKEDIEWVYTLDQDTISSEYIIEKYMEIDCKKVGIICSKVYEEGLQQELQNFNSYKYNDLKEPYEIDSCITSGSLTNVMAWVEVGGFDEYMFIDYVDFDFALSLKEAGYKIIKVPSICIYHELGNTKMLSILKWNIRVTRHTPIRKYYMGRNIIYYMKKHKGNVNSIIEILRLFKIELFIILFEKNKIQQEKNFLNGIVDGIKINSNS